MVEYCIIKHNDTYALQEKIVQYLNKGWTLQGGVSSFFEDTTLDYMDRNGALTKFKPQVIFMQAIIKKSKKTI